MYAIRSIFKAAVCLEHISDNYFNLVLTGVADVEIALSLKSSLRGGFEVTTYLININRVGSLF